VNPGRRAARALKRLFGSRSGGARGRTFREHLAAASDQPLLLLSTDAFERSLAAAEAPVRSPEKFLGTSVDARVD